MAPSARRFLPESTDQFPHARAAPRLSFRGRETGCRSTSSGSSVFVFDHGGPVRAASAVTAFGNGFLVVQDDATHAAWFLDGLATAVRLLPAGRRVRGRRPALGHQAPQTRPRGETCAVLDGADPAVLVMGSGSSPARMRWVLLTQGQGHPHTRVADMTELYRVAAEALEVPLDALNLEGACVLDRTLRWFHRGLPSAGQPSASVDLDLVDVLAAVHGHAGADTITVAAPRRYVLGSVANVGLAITDAVALPGHGVLCAAAAEDSPNTRDDGPVVASALVLLRDDGVADVGTAAPDRGRRGEGRGPHAGRRRRRMGAAARRRRRRRPARRVPRCLAARPTVRG